MTRKLDVLFIQPNSRPIYQGLRGKFSAIETPTWALLLAQSCRVAGFGVEILDCDAHDLTDKEAVEVVHSYNPRLVVMVVYGSEPNQGTTRMASAVPLAQLLRNTYPGIKICFAGSHAQALPKEVLTLSCVDFVLLNEGVIALRNLLATDLGGDLWNIRGIGWKPWAATGCTDPILNDPEQATGQDSMNGGIPGYAWDLLPDLNKYRSHFWHSGYDHDKRSPFAAVYTSLGCPFMCQFCMINLVNRVDNSPSVTAADSNYFRYWSVEHTLKQIEGLVDRGVHTIRISDEMFLLRPAHFEPILKGITERWGDSLNLWCYARVDTVKDRYLKLLRGAGMRWICLGIESGNRNVRRTASKGSFQDVDITKVVQEIEAHDIDVISNFIVGLEDDTHESMCATLDLALELNTSMMNVYPAMALPGTPLYAQAKTAGKPLPDTYAGFGFLSYECTPLGTATLSPADVVRFRDEMFHTYWSNPAFQNKVEQKFGPQASANIRDMLKVKLKRKLLNDPPPDEPLVETILTGMDDNTV